MTELGRALVEGGVMPSDWAPALSAVPRTEFLPELIWPFDMATGRAIPVRRSTDPETWERHALADEPIVTQWDDGAHTGDEPGHVSTSSASMPSVVFTMLRELDVQPGNRVLEIGTGTGWNAALLAHRVGAENVVSVEVDATVAAAAQNALERFGLPVLVVRGDGDEGWADAAPYDRIIATVGVRRIASDWLEQCAPGAVIVAPWGTDYSNGDGLIRLVVDDDGRKATGRFVGPAEFMKMRVDRTPSVVHSKYVPEDMSGAEQSETDLTEAEFVGDRFAPHTFVTGVRVPLCTRVVADKRDGARPVWFYSLSDLSWACVLFRDGGTARVWQSGPRHLWSEVEGAYRWWVRQGRPGFDRFGLTVDRVGEWAWLDKPDNLVVPFSPPAP